MPADPTMALPLPHATWNDEWRPLLVRFAAAVATDEIVPRRVSYETLPLPLRLRIQWYKLRDGGKEPRNLYTVTWHVPAHAVRDAGLRRALDSFALAPEHREHRLYRLAYNNNRLEAAAGRRKLEWAAIGRRASACKA